ncbi:WASH complex subunit 4-like [Portunus trituberculatus]|uniref:WASH complex subunit 4-like n=1 Tax=Portunus trituberculatus TaxID=210409 RepID=UPI001E1CBC14|nr:WASH complex subunit 4-like [Portunus trituberculatus]
MTVDIDYDENSHKTVAEQELRRYNRIVEQHGEQLEEIIEALGPYPAPPWDPKLDPIMLKMAPFENLSLVRLVQSGNKMVNKVVLTFSALCLEASQLVEEAQSKLYPPLMLYGNRVAAEGEKTGESQMSLSRVLSTLHHAACYVQRVQKVIRNIMHQLTSLYRTDKKSSGTIDVSDVHFQVMYEHLGSLLGTLITMDEIVLNNSVLHEHWGAYRRLVRSAASDQHRFGQDKASLQPLEKLLADVETAVMQGTMFMSVLRQVYDCEGLVVTRNGVLREEMMTVVLGWCGQLEQSSGEGWWCDNQPQVVGVTALAVFHQVVFNCQDRRLSRVLGNLFKKFPSITLVGSMVWLPERHIPSAAPTLSQLFDRKTQDALLAYRTTHLAQKTQTIAKEAQAVNLQVCGWAVNLDAAARKHSSQMNNQDLNQRASLLLQGLIIAHTVKYNMETVLNLHSVLSRPMGKACALSVCSLVESLKAIEHTYHRHSSLLADSLPHVIQYLTYQVLSIISTVKNRVSNSRLDAQRLDILMALNLVEHMLSGSGTRERRLVTRVALSLANQAKALRDEDISSLLVGLRRLDLACELQARVKQATNCAILYHHTVILPTYLTHYLQTLQHVHRIHFMLAALQDCAVQLEGCCHLATPDQLVNEFKEEMYGYIKELVLDKVCQEVETELRLSTHSHLQLDSRNPFQTSIRDLSPLLALEPFCLLSSTLISVKDYVEQYLESTFYALTVVAPHDWRTYEEMRNLAASKYNLFTVPSFLPSHTLDQGVDVLEIMRNIHVFVCHYLYNLNQQFFIEAASNNKHLNTVTIKHIANSIRTHGAGIINTTVNFTYQFLRRKFHVFSQFLYDEQIKSRLLKDRQLWREAKANQEHFPYESAEKFNRSIRKLGVTPEGLSYLDQFRGLISHIGNAMGFVRLVRSGGLHCSSNAARFIPDLQDVASLEQLCRDAHTSPQTLTAAENLDAVINNLTRNFHQDTDYFKLLVDVFAPALQDKKNSHLKNFYLIIPPMTINFVESSLTAKDNMNKKNKSRAAFTDDGFAMGVAYLLKVLDQNAAFDSLHWWSGVRRRFIKEREKVEQQRQLCSSGDDKLQQTLALTMSRLQQYQQEFELMYLSLSSARVFFRGDWASSSSSSSSGDSQKSDTQSIGSDCSGKEKPLNKSIESNA